MASRSAARSDLKKKKPARLNGSRPFPQISPKKTGDKLNISPLSPISKEWERMGVPAKKWTKPDYRKVVEEMLRLYPIFKKSLESGLGGMGLFPSLTSSYDLKVVGGKKESTTEKYAIKRAERQELVKLVEYALSFLDDEEREVIKSTYFLLNRPPIYIVFQELNMSERSYHRIKRRAIKKIAFALGLI